MFRIGVACSVIFAAGLIHSGAIANRIDSEHLFGFTEGSDIGAKGDKEFELSGHGRFGARRGSYSAVSTEVEGKFTLLDNFRIAPGLSLARYDIVDVPGFGDRNSWAFEALSFEMKYRILDRQRSFVGLTVGATPSWGRVDANGEAVDSYGAEFFLLADKELVPGRFFGAFNISYDPASTRSRLTGEWTRDSSLQLSTAVAAQITEGVFLGGEIRYARSYGGLALDHFSGHALFVGPTFYAKLSNTSWIAAGWNIQVAGRSVEDGSALDLTNFQRHEVVVRMGFSF